MNSKQKGSKNERGISHLFEEWTGHKFSRTPQSGGLNWHNKLSSGDVICIDEEHMAQFPFSIEAKFHSELDLLHLMDGTMGKKSTKIKLFWEQCERDAKHDGKIPCLFMRRNGMKADMHFVALPTKFYRLVITSHYYIEPTYGTIRYVGKFDVMIINSGDFFNIPYWAIVKAGKEYREKYLTKKLKKS